MKRIAQYEVLGKIGEGGMGSVFVARDTRLDRKVALKVLLGNSPDPDAVARFEREARAVASLSHPNILAIYDFGSDGNQPYIVMELLDGQTLREALEAGPLPLARTLGYAREIAQGLAAAHDRGVVHRDLKPANIFITDDNHVKIVDFGLASVRRPISSDSDTMVAGATAPGMVLGTASYMSPEQVRGEPGDHRSDIFSFGSVLFEMLTRTRAFYEPTGVETMHAVLKVDPKFDPLYAAVVPDALIQVVRRCLEKRAADRFQSARDLEFSVQTILTATLSGQASGISSASAARAALPRPADAGHAIAVLPFANMSRDEDMEYLSDGITEDIINAVAQIPGLRVAARTSSFAFKGRAVDVAEVGERLRVTAVLEGSVRRAGNRLRVSARLINVEDGYQLWAEKYDRELDDLFAIQDDIAANIAGHLQLALARARAPQGKLTAGQMQAYDLYLQGRYFVEQRGAGIAKGLGLYQKALAMDPDFALAHAALAETLVLLRVYGVGKPGEHAELARRAARRAIEIDSSLAEAHNALAMVRMYFDWDWAGAEEAFNRALEINPNYVSARYWRGLLIYGWIQGRFDEATAEIRKAIDLDPIGTIPLYALGLALVAAGRPDQAIRVAIDGLDRDPASASLYRVLAGASLAQGDVEQALDAMEKTLGLTMREPAILAEMGAALATIGRLDEARQVHDELVARSKTASVPPTSHAVMAEALGDHEAAVAHLRRAVEERDPIFLFAATWPSMASIRQDPRVQALFDDAGIKAVRR